MDIAPSKIAPSIKGSMKALLDLNFHTRVHLFEEEKLFKTVLVVCSSNCRDDERKLAKSPSRPGDGPLILIRLRR